MADTPRPRQDAGIKTGEITDMEVTFVLDTPWGEEWGEMSIQPAPHWLNPKKRWKNEFGGDLRLRCGYDKVVVVVAAAGEWGNKELSVTCRSSVNRRKPTSGKLQAAPYRDVCGASQDRTRYGLGFASRPEVDPCGSGKEERLICGARSQLTRALTLSKDPFSLRQHWASELVWRAAQEDNTGQWRSRTVVPALVKKYDSSMRHLFGHCPEDPERNVQSASYRSIAVPYGHMNITSFHWAKHAAACSLSLSLGRISGARTSSGEPMLVKRADPVRVDGFILLAYSVRISKATERAGALVRRNSHPVDFDDATANNVRQTPTFARIPVLLPLLVWSGLVLPGSSLT
ncbi:hypothetical protein EDB86DRAFT_2826364 [Lactarius hatsudake]|nr:hypothetical protein EDB86DRAFT_2826364 [Lactarius hatsudake]